MTHKVGDKMMIRKATSHDINQVEKCIVERLEYEQVHGAYTSWKLNIYPTRETAEKGVLEGSLYVMEQCGDVYAFIIASRNQPPKFDYIEWKYLAQPDEVLVINLLCVRPSKERCGIGKSMACFIIEEAKSMNCKTVRLDTGRQNVPAIALYTNIGFEFAGSNKNFLFYELKI